MTSIALAFWISSAVAAAGNATAASHPNPLVAADRRAAVSSVAEEAETARAAPAPPSAGDKAPDLATRIPPRLRRDTLPGDAAARTPGVSYTAITAPASGGRGSRGGGVQWRSLVRDSVVLLTVQHAFRATFEDGTWHETTTGVFWDDYVASVTTLCCWDDGDKFTTNYLFHPLMGSTSAFVFANNHGGSRTARPGTRQYWTAKGKALAYAGVYSAYFEIGPVLSESAIGNVGLKPGQQTWGDFVVTPVVGTGFSVIEDLLQTTVVAKVRRNHRAWGNTLSVVLNPTRAVANVVNGSAPWRVPRALGGS